MLCYCAISFIFVCILFFFFKQKTAYEMRISDWSSDVCSSDFSFSKLISAWSIGEPNKSSASIFTPVPIGGQMLNQSNRNALPHVIQFSLRRGDREGVVWGKCVSVSVDIGCRPLYKKKNNTCIEAMCVSINN